jgi:hypothetical protein
MTMCLYIAVYACMGREVVQLCEHCGLVALSPVHWLRTSYTPAATRPAVSH